MHVLSGWHINNMPLKRLLLIISNSTLNKVGANIILITLNNTEL